MTRPSDAEHAAGAARHVFEKPPATVEQRLEPLRDQGVSDEASLSAHCQSVMTAADTQCFRGAHGRESYANDRMNTIVHTREGSPSSNTVFYNDERDREGGRTATERLGDMATAERAQYSDSPCTIRTGGSAALEQDRQAEAAGKSSGDERDDDYPPPPPPPPEREAEDKTQSQGHGR